MSYKYKINSYLMNMPRDKRAEARDEACKALAVSPGTIRRWAVLKEDSTDTIPVEAAMYFAGKLNMTVAEFCSPIKSTIND